MRQLGNAVPVRMLEIVAAELHRMLGRGDFVASMMRRMDRAGAPTPGSLALCIRFDGNSVGIAPATLRTGCTGWGTESPAKMGPAAGNAGDEFLSGHAVRGTVIVRPLYFADPFSICLNPRSHSET